MSDGPDDDDPVLGAAQAAYDAGRYGEALEGARAADHAGDENLPALRLRCLAAFRIGELGESADAALRLIAAAQRRGDADAMRFDALAVSVVAAGELGRFDQSIEHLQLLQSAAARSGSMTEFVRARGTTANCFALLGDPWAAQRLLSELLGMFQARSDELRLEATTRGNHASVCLQIARLARLAGDAAAADEALDHAQASIGRAREIAQTTGDARVLAFADVHAAELALLRGETDAALALLDGAVRRADAAGLLAHARLLRLLEAEVRVAGGDVASAHALLDHVAARIGEGHELALRLRLHTLLQQVLTAEGDASGALAQGEQARVLGRLRQYRQAQAQSRWLRVRLELEHMYRFRPGVRRGSGSSRPGALTPS
jgi:tetratricopeptide (TPR) repeat protein